MRSINALNTVALVLPWTVVRQIYNFSLVSFQSPCFRSVLKFTYELDQRPWCGSVIGGKLHCARFRSFPPLGFTSPYFHSLFLCELDLRPLTLQFIRENCSAPDLGLFLLSALLRLIFATLFNLYELDQRPLILQSIWINCSATD